MRSKWTNKGETKGKKESGRERGMPVRRIKGIKNEEGGWRERMRVSE